MILDSIPLTRYTALVLLDAIVLSVVDQTRFETGVPSFKWGALAQSVECASPGEEVLGSIPAVAACSLLVGLVSV